MTVLISMNALKSMLCEKPDTTMQFTEKKTSSQEIEENRVRWIIKTLKILCSTSFKNTLREEITKSWINPRYSDALNAKTNAKEMRLKINKT